MEDTEFKEDQFYSKKQRQRPQVLRYGSTTTLLLRVPLFGLGAQQSERMHADLGHFSRYISPSKEGERPGLQYYNVILQSEEQRCVMLCSHVNTSVCHH